MIKCWVYGHDWVNWEADKRFCHRCGREEEFGFDDSKWAKVSKPNNIKTVLLIFAVATVVTLLSACNMEITQKSFDVKANGELRCVSVWSAFDEPFTITEGGCVKFYGSTPAGTTSDYPGPIFCGNVTIERRVDDCPVEAQ
jgi:hypothetical protein